MSILKPKLPTEKVVHFPPLDQYSPKKMYEYRLMKSFFNLQLPDVGGGDLNEVQRRDWLKKILAFQTPILALTLFQGVVALEEYIRELSNGLGQIEKLDAIDAFKKINILPVKLKNSVNYPSESLEVDKPMLNPYKVNKRFKEALNIEPLSNVDRLMDLILLRHIIAHNASNIRQIDIVRFQYYEVEANHIFTPTEEFVRDTLVYLNKVGNEFHQTVLDRVLELLKAEFMESEKFSSSALVEKIVFLFGYPLADLGLLSDDRIQETTIFTQEEELRNYLEYRKKLEISSIEELTRKLYEKIK